MRVQRMGMTWKLIPQGAVACGGSAGSPTHPSRVREEKGEEVVNSKLKADDAVPRRWSTDAKTLGGEQGS